MDYTVVLGHNRHDLLPQVIAAAVDQCDQLVLVDNASSPPLVCGHDRVSIIRDQEQPPNLSRLWNRALNAISVAEWERAGPSAEHQRPPQWNVALICDDVILPPGWYEAVREGMRTRGRQASAASTHPYWENLPEPFLLRELNNQPLMRMCPWAFMLRGEQQLRADPRLRWWFCDTDLDWQARRLLGTAIVPGPVAANLYENDWTNRRPELRAQVDVDGATFAEKWRKYL